MPYYPLKSSKIEYYVNDASSDIDLNAGTWSNIVSHSPPAGTWLVIGQANFFGPIQLSTMYVSTRIWDPNGAVIYGATEAFDRDSGASTRASISLQVKVIITLAATTTLTLSCISNLNAGVYRSTYYSTTSPAAKLISVRLA